MSDIPEQIRLKFRNSVSNEISTVRINVYNSTRDNIEKKCLELANSTRAIEKIMWGKHDITKIQRTESIWQMIDNIRSRDETFSPEDCPITFTLNVFGGAASRA